MHNHSEHAKMLPVPIPVSGSPMNLHSRSRRGFTTQRSSVSFLSRGLHIFVEARTSICWTRQVHSRMKKLHKNFCNSSKKLPTAVFKQAKESFKVAKQSLFADRWGELDKKPFARRKIFCQLTLKLCVFSDYVKIFIVLLLTFVLPP